jgi:hypothetical protein
MNDTLKVLANYPEIGFASSLGSGVVHWLGILNPILSFISLSIGIILGITTIYMKIKGEK